MRSECEKWKRARVAANGPRCAWLININSLIRQSLTPPEAEGATAPFNEKQRIYRALLGHRNGREEIK